MKFWPFKKLSILSTTEVLNHYKRLNIVLVENCKFWLGDHCTFRQWSHLSSAGQVLHARLVARCWATLCHVTPSHIPFSTTAFAWCWRSLWAAPLSTVGKTLSLTGHNKFCGECLSFLTVKIMNGVAFSLGNPATAWMTVRGALLALSVINRRCGVSW